MRIGSSGQRRPAEEMFTPSHELGFNWLEIGCETPANFPDRWDDRRIESIKAMGQRYGISYCVHTASYVNSAEIFPTVRKASEQHLIEYVELAAKLEAAHVVIHCGFHFSIYPDAVYKALLETFDAVVEVAEKHKMPLLIENMNLLHPDAEILYLGCTVEELKKVFDTIKSPYLGLALDIGHANLVPGGVEPFIEAFGPRIGGLHIHDNDGKIDKHWPAGRGTVDWKDVFARLKKIGFEGSHTIELSSFEKVVESRDYLQKIGVL